MNVVTTIETDQQATASVCSLLFLGTFAGTNLRKRRVSHSARASDRRGRVHSMLALSAATGVVVNFERRSLREEAERLLEAADKLRLGRMWRREIESSPRHKLVIEARVIIILSGHKSGKVK
jgi:hypothetical protein